MSTITSMELQSYKQRMKDYQNGVDQFLESRRNYKRELEHLMSEASRISFSKKSKAKKCVSFHLEKNTTLYYDLDPEEVAFKKMSLEQMLALNFGKHFSSSDLLNPPAIITSNKGKLYKLFQLRK